MEKDIEMMNDASNEPAYVETNVDAKNGQDKCPKCGSTDISPTKDGKLKCNFCRHTFSPKKADNFVEDISSLEGQVLSTGVKDIDRNASNMVTLKCSSCGAEVVIDTSESEQARCHWCRNYLSLNEKIPNGAVPDVVLPFKLTKEEAEKSIQNFVSKRKFYAHPKFKREFTTENIMGVYFPYMVVDANAHAHFSGEGEHLLRRYTVGSDEHRETYYDAEAYYIEREFDITLSGLTVESNTDRLNSAAKDKTNNIINSIMPFDTENCVKWNANYLRGYTSEKRDINVNQIKDLVEEQSKDVIRFSANETLKYYDRGVAWSKEDYNIKGQQWKAAYLPVWLYSYQQIKGSGSLLHYVAVNARTKETMGSVPIHMPKLFIVSFIVEILGLLGMIQFDFDYDWAFLLSGPIYFSIIYARYRNQNARHFHEKETTHKMTNLRKVDNKIEVRKRLKNASIRGANNKRVNGASTKKSILNNIKDNIKDNINI